MTPDKFSVKARKNSFRYAFRGLASLLKNEHNSRIHTAAAVISVTAGLILRISLPEWCILTVVIGMVFVAELLNSSVETLADVAEPGWNTKIGLVKDYSAAAVLIASIVSLIAGALIFIPKIISLLLN